MSATPAKSKKATKPKKPSTHPKYNEMIVKAITTLKERGGSSRQAILKHVLANYNVGKDENAVNSRLKLALRRGVTKGTLKQAKGTGASGSFRIGDKKEAANKKAAKAKKPAAEGGAAAKPKKAKSPKKAKKSAKPKTPKKAKTAKPKKAKSPKKAAKPKAKKSPKKAAKKAKK